MSNVEKVLTHWEGHTFSSGNRTGQDYIRFQREFKRAIVEQATKAGYTLRKFNSGHYECSAVLEAAGEKYAYVAIRDVRVWPSGWIDSILCRTMAHQTDWCGGMNHYTALTNLDRELSKL